MKTLVVATALVLALTAVSDAGSLEKRHGVGFRMGMWNMVADARVDVIEGSVSASVGNSGFLGGVAYNYWLTESLALDIGASVMRAKVEMSVGLLNVSTKTSAVTSVLIGMKYYLPASTYSGSVRPFLKGAVGLFKGSQSDTQISLLVIVESRSETAFGGQLGGGVDFILSRKFLLGVNVEYNLISDFDQTIGGAYNYSGPEFSAGLSFLFGRGIN
jgi:outer membrane protein W